jgi:hypothetical protein
MEFRTPVLFLSVRGRARTAITVPIFNTSVPASSLISDTLMANIGSSYGMGITFRFRIRIEQFVKDPEKGDREYDHKEGVTYQEE